MYSRMQLFCGGGSDSLVVAGSLLLHRGYQYTCAQSVSSDSLQMQAHKHITM